MTYCHSGHHWPISMLRLQLNLDRAKLSRAHLRVLARAHDHAHRIQNSVETLKETYGDDLSPDQRGSAYRAREDRQKSLGPNLGRQRKNIRGVEEKCKAAANILQQNWRTLSGSIRQSRPCSPAIRRSNASSGTAHPLLATFPVSLS